MPQIDIDKFFTVTRDAHGGVSLFPKPALQRSIDRTIAGMDRSRGRVKTRDAVPPAQLLSERTDFQGEAVPSTRQDFRTPAELSTPQQSVSTLNRDPVAIPITGNDPQAPNLDFDESDIPNGTKGFVRTRLFVYPKLEKGHRLTLERNEETGGWDLCLLTPAFDMGTTPPGASGTRDQVHRTQGNDPLLVSMNRTNRAMNDGGTLTFLPGAHKRGSDAEKLRAQNDANKKFYGMG